MTSFGVLAFLKEIGPILIAIFSGGLIKSLIDYLLGKKKDNRDDFKIILETWAQDNKRLRESEEQCAKRLNDLEKQIIILQNKLTMMETAHYDLPFPQWLKDMDGVMLSLNSAYEKEFLQPVGKNVNDYIGKTDYEIWDAETAKQYRINDLLAFSSTDKFWRGVEPLKTSNGIEYKNWLIVKYVRYAGKIPIGIAGLAIPYFDNCVYGDKCGLVSSAKISN